MKGKRYTEEQIIGILRDQYLPAFWCLIVTCFNKGSSQKR